MKYIYARAACAIIWLGLSDEFTVDALLLIGRAAKLLRETANDEKNKKRELPLFSESEKWRPLLELLSRPWFGRAWVFQESAMASFAIAVVGEYEHD